jgi:hypothetical protein
LILIPHFLTPMEIRRTRVLTSTSRCMNTIRCFVTTD